MLSKQLEELDVAAVTYRVSLQIIARVMKQIGDCNYAPFEIRVRPFETSIVKTFCKRHAFKYKVVVTAEESTFTITF